MAQHSFAIQKAIYDSLNSDTTISGMITGIFDDVNEGTAYPYIVIGDDTAINVGTKTVDALEYTLTLHVWSQYRGRKEVKEIMAAIYDVLHDADLTVQNSVLVNIRQEFEQTLVDGDGITRHGVIRFRAVVFDD